MTGNGGAFSSGCSTTPLPAITQRTPSSRRATHSTRHVPTVTPCHARRQRLAHRPRMTLPSLLLALCFALLFACQGVAADNVLVAHSPHQHETELLFDRSPPPIPPMRFLYERDGASPDSPASTTNQVPQTSTTTSTGIRTATPSSAARLPRPFDTSLGNNFTSPSCPAFFQRFLHNKQFNDCLPFSLLLQTSNSFFVATRSLPILTQTLDATCNVDYPTCSALMANLAEQIQSNSNCGQDLSMGNPIAQQAYNGFVAYAPLYHVGCLKNSSVSLGGDAGSGGEYCFAAAATNLSAPTSSYIYYLPLGVQLPGGAAPACNDCLRRTMAVFSGYASNGTQPLSQDYGAAAQQVDMYCGPQYVSAATVQTSAAASSLRSRHTSSAAAATATGIGIFISLFWATSGFLV